ncbi:DUF4192 family protein [Demequina sp. NBRC 110051]|uniref:DUF4192 family protein n=1 Tax=Demequina sp. NBRC 110051 TaxID=1570340 RepID=UPI00135646C1|nr:DUF4192 family protein [Demequina sp. NBRC 110051]
MTTSTIRNPGDLIAALPAMLGEEPHDAVIVLGTAKDGEVLAAVKVDRVDLCVPELSPDTGAALARDLAFAGADRAIVVSWSDLAPGAGCPALDEIMPCLRLEGIDAHAWVTDGNHYWAGLCMDPDCCPPDERPAPQVAPVPRGPRVTVDGWRGNVVHDRAVQVTGNDKRRASRAADRWSHHRDDDRDAWCRQGWSELEATVDGEAEPPIWGRCIAAAQDVRVRDAVIVMWLGGSPSVIWDVLEGRASRGVHAVMEGALRPGSATLPEPGVCVAALEWTSQAMAYARLRERAVFHALRAVVMWWSDDLAAARREAMRALGCDDGYTLAMLLIDMCDLGLRPGWRRGADGRPSAP